MPSKKVLAQQPRLRVFAGPNGSGKSTIIQTVKATKQNGHFIDFGNYINADDIAHKLKKALRFSFASFRLKFDNKRFIEFAEGSGLLDKNFPSSNFLNSYSVSGNSITITNVTVAERLGQIVARFLREEMLRLKRRFSLKQFFLAALT